MPDGTLKPAAPEFPPTDDEFTFPLRYVVLEFFIESLSRVDTNDDDDDSCRSEFDKFCGDGCDGIWCKDECCLVSGIIDNWFEQRALPTELLLLFKMPVADGWWFVANAKACDGGGGGGGGLKSPGGVGTEDGLYVTDGDR